MNKQSVIIPKMNHCKQKQKENKWARSKEMKDLHYMYMYVKQISDCALLNIKIKINLYCMLETKKPKENF